MPSRPTGTSIKSHTARVAVYLGTRLNVIDATIHLRYLHVTVQLRKETGMRRRDILAGAGSLAAGATLSFPAPAIAQGIRQLKMVTDWPAGSPGLQSSAARLAQRIGTASDGRINIEVFPAGALVRPFETFDAVGAGVADMYHSSEYYWEKKSPAFNFFGAVPFGFTAAELFAWVQYGGGQELWDALSGQFNVKPLLCLNTGCQMGGWSTRDRVAGGVQGAALPDARSWRGGSSPHGRDR